MSSEAIEPTQVWTRDEWLRDQPWGGMPSSNLRRFFKSEGFMYMYSAGPKKMSEFLDKQT